MDLSFSEEQVMLRESARRFLKNECDRTYILEMWADERGFTRSFWNKMAELGWFALRIPEQYGGLGLSFVDLGVLFEEMGRVALPGPFLSTVMAVEAIAEAGSDEQKAAWLPEIGEGNIRATLALWEPDYRFDAAGINLSAVPDGNDFLLDGKKLFVPDAHVSELMVVAARTGPGTSEQGISLFLVDDTISGISRHLLKTMDPGRKQCAVVFDKARIPAECLVGEVDKAWPVFQSILNKSAVALSLDSVGGGRKVLDMAVDYAKIRVQFDPPSGLVFAKSF